MKNARYKLILVVAFAAGVAGCVPAVKLAPEPLPPATSQKGTVAAGEVRNLRPPEQGGQDFKLLGRVRGGFGNPFALNAEPGQELDTVLRASTTDALAHNGYAATGSSKRRLDLEVQRFWCDGYMGYKIDALVVAKLVDTASGRVLAQREIPVAEGFAIVMSYGPLHSAFDSVMNRIKTELVSFIGSPEFRSAAT